MLDMSSRGNRSNKGKGVVYPSGTSNSQIQEPTAHQTRGQRYRRGGASRGTWSGRGQKSSTQSKPTPSRETLAKIDVIKKSSVQFLERANTLEDSDDEDEDYLKDPEKKKVLETTLRNYYMTLVSSNGNSSAAAAELDSLPEFLSGTFLAANSTCLICLSSIRRSHAVWNCSLCFCTLHLQCIQHWIVDGARRRTLLSTDLFPNQEQFWACPKCRKEYPQSQSPKTYKCFCGKVDDPTDDPWLLPHSCGETCDKPLQNNCGHHCFSLCHPGPCPPCPKTVNVKCHCGRSSPKVQRCGSKGWSCGRVCRKVLLCGQHVCESVCHEGPCPECHYSVQQPCRCGKVTQERLCTSLEWSCGQVCGKRFDCGHHQCQEVCHEGECGTCPRTGKRKCPCGKTSHTLPCNQDVPVCGDTCLKSLSCGLHACMRLCHKGDCGQCLQRVHKLCRCGKKEREVTCGTEFLCEAKCSNMRQCERHPCKRKCCDGKCPLCEQTCGRTLNCGQHKCSAPCHIGLCYPCINMITLSCHCGKTKKQVPCAQRHRSKKPVCRELCIIPPKCHHPHRLAHRCHSGPCPPCDQECGLELTCGHYCPSKCHTEPQQKPKEDIQIDATIPWAQMKSILQKHEEDMKQLVVQPCPPCLVPVPQGCDGGHEVKNFPCSQVHTYVCGRKCGRVLPCGNHLCERICHLVINPPNMREAGEDCSSCDLDCEKPRPRGCTHICNLPCHPEPCPPCHSYIRLRCHCSTMPIILTCHEWTSADYDQKLQLQACNNQCTKILSCGHRCSYNCHHGNCSPVDQCTQRLSLRCSCKRLKKEVKCNEKHTKRPVCDAECARIQQEKKEEEARRAAEQQAEEEKRRQSEQEKLMRLSQPRKRKRKKQEEIEVTKEDSFIKKQKIKLIGLAVILVIIFLLFLFQIISL